MIQIALVEDEEIYVKQLTEYIRKYQTERGRSIKVTVFGDGEDITENYSGGFDIILMDIQMLCSINTCYYTLCSRHRV